MSSYTHCKTLIDLTIDKLGGDAIISMLIVERKLGSGQYTFRCAHCKKPSKPYIENIKHYTNESGWLDYKLYYERLNQLDFKGYYTCDKCKKENRYLNWPKGLTLMETLMLHHNIVEVCQADYILAKINKMQINWAEL